MKSPYMRTLTRTLTMTSTQKAVTASIQVPRVKCCHREKMRTDGATSKKAQIARACRKQIS